MQRDMNQWKHLSGAKIVTISPRGVPFMPGIGLILLGAIIFVAPKFFLAAVGTFFVLLGGVACYITWKFLSFKRQVSKLAEEFRNGVDVRAFQVQNTDDIDITEPDNKKIYYH
jgi:membrane protein implicated in regulation of membrane protease activity